jgi:hypothetical protein
LLVYEFALVAFGIELLAVVLVTVIKVFVWDMAELSGLYRAASFLGLVCRSWQSAGSISASSAYLSGQPRWRS